MCLRFVLLKWLPRKSMELWKTDKFDLLVLLLIFQSLNVLHWSPSPWHISLGVDGTWKLLLRPNSFPCEWPAGMLFRSWGFLLQRLAASHTYLTWHWVSSCLYNSLILLLCRNTTQVLSSSSPQRWSEMINVCYGLTWQTAEQHTAAKSPAHPQWDGEGNGRKKWATIMDWNKFNCEKKGRD